jgi:hypothetical protein
VVISDTTRASTSQAPDLRRRRAYADQPRMPSDINDVSMTSTSPGYSHIMTNIIHPLSYTALALGYRRQVAINVINNHKTEKAGFELFHRLLYPTRTSPE